MTATRTASRVGGRRKVYDVTAREAATKLGICAETMKRWARDGKVPAKKNMSGFWLFSVDDLDRLPVHGVVGD